MKKRFATILVLLTLTLRAFAQEAAAPQEARTGFTGGGFPILGYDPDMGMRLGVRGNVYDFGREGWYPNPRQTIYTEASWYLKGSQLYTLSYDNRFLIPGIRFTFTAQYADEKAYDFYGFGGYASYYDASLPTGYYKMSRKMPVGKIDFTGKIFGKLYWKFGYHFRYFILDEFDGDALEELPFKKSLFEWYQDLGFIAADEFNGGMTSAWRAGLSYDSRDAEAAPSRGLWADAFMEWAPKWMGTNKPYGSYSAVLRQYFPLMRDKLVLAYRAGIQGYIGKPAFYVLPFESVLGGPGWDHDGFGGYNTIRGVMRGRLQGQSVCYFNAELRWKFFETRVLDQDLAFGANIFFDGGRVLKEYTDVSVDADTWKVPLAAGKIPEQLVKGAPESFHLSAGGGLRAILNRNFIISLDYGQAFNRQDNRRGGSLYFNTGFLF